MTSKKLLIGSVTCLQLKTAFIWPPKNQEMNPSQWFYIRLGILIVSSIFVLYIPVLIHIHKLFERNLDASEDFALVASYYGFISTMICYSKNHKKVCGLMCELSDFNEFGKPQRFDELNKNLDFYSKLASGYTVVGMIVYNAMKIYKIPECKEERDEIQVCGLMIPLWAPWTVDTFSSSYIALFAMTLTYSVIFTRATLFYAIQVLEIALNIELRIQHLNSYLVECFDHDLKASRVRLVQCIRYHQKIINFAVRLNDAFFSTVFCHIVASVLACASVARQAVNQDIAALLHYLGWIVSIFVICWAGQILTDSSVTVADACFESQWIKACPRLRKDLIFVMRRSQRSFQLKAGPFNVLCFALFVSIIKLSYSVLTLIS